MSSIQSVAGQPVAAPLSMPIHQGVSPSSAICWVKANNSAHVCGIVYPAASKSSFGYHTRLLPLNRCQTPAITGWPSGPAIVPISSQLWLYCCFNQSAEMKLFTSTTLPCFTKFPSNPGCGKSTTSGASPASTRTPIVASNSFVPSYWMSMPVFSSKSAIALLNLTASSSVNGPIIVTALPLNSPAKARAR